jgi:GT2 family glycosyltransferase
VAVLLALRGRDPFLSATLAGLLEQRYPDYTVHVVVDSAEDPVWEDLRPWLERTPPSRLSVELLEQPGDACSLKSSAMLQAYGRLAPRFEIVAFLDADVTPHPTWLSELVAPLHDDRTAAATGQRWYALRSGEWGTLIRFLWNVGAVVQIWLNGIVWAGSLAMRRRTIEEIGLPEAWRSAFSDDGAATRELRRCGRKVCLVPSLMMLNREGISLPNFFRWMSRQLLAARPSGPAWRVVVAHAVNLAATHTLAGVAVVAALWTQQLWSLFAVSSLWAVYWTSSLLAVVAVDRRVRRLLSDLGRDVPEPLPGTAARLLPAIGLAHVLSVLTVGSASFRHRVSWRGIEYEILGAKRIRRLNYAPFPPVSAGPATESVV